ncbi:uncharacterized protein LOC109599219 isoform X2 [Aethina tumida]|uniref:uncharacterized protein LOC109599219 isoform X2 n=1 Tax=Aethina tumida TaxID=116153 RepID=UPI00096B127D|nr:uncharacterized protein LOC109599219 isoform X2 [Aethina tumida]
MIDVSSTIFKYLTNSTIITGGSLLIIFYIFSDFIKRFLTPAQPMTVSQDNGLSRRSRKSLVTVHQTDTRIFKASGSTSGLVSPTIPFERRSFNKIDQLLSISASRHVRRIKAKILKKRHLKNNKNSTAILERKETLEDFTDYQDDFVPLEACKKEYKMETVPQVYTYKNDSVENGSSQIKLDFLDHKEWAKETEQFL